MTIIMTPDTNYHMSFDIGDTVYWVDLYSGIETTEIEKIILTKEGIKVKLSKNNFYETSIHTLNRHWFLTKEDAEKKLKELKGEEI